MLLIAPLTSLASGSNRWQWRGLWGSKPNNFWVAMSHNFQLNNYAHNRHVAHEIRWFLRQHQYLYELTRNSKLYIYYIYQETQRRGMPAELALLPMIESNYKPFAYSSTGAVGLWQMMPGTASGFGLRINWWYDGRRDLIASTNAALNYLQYLHDYFGNWLLALAAYNAGEGRVIAAIRYNRRRHRPTDFWSLPLPLQTRLYVPKLLALAQILEKPNHFGAKIVSFSNKPYFTTIKLSKPINLVHLAKLAKINTKTLRKLNAGFRRWTAAPHRNYNLLVPINVVDDLRSKLVKELVNQHYKKVNQQHVLVYNVESGDTLSEIANQYGTSLQAIKTTNHLHSNTIDVHQRLLIPQGSHLALNQSKIAKHVINEDYLPGPKRIDYIVKKNDSITKIAHRYHIKPHKIYYWNNLSHHEKIKPKQHLIIWKKRKIRYYKVRPSDSLSKIAARFGTTIKHIKAINKLSSNLIRTGQRLKIPATA